MTSSLIFILIIASSQIALAFDVGFLWGYLDQRASELAPMSFKAYSYNLHLEAQKNLDQAKDNLKSVEEQKVLAKMDADFQQIKPYIDDISTKLGIFAMIWSFVSTSF